MYLARTKYAQSLRIISQVAVQEHLPSSALLVCLVWFVELVVL